MDESTRLDLISTSATHAVAMLRAGETHPGELLDAALERIAEIEPSVNALPTVCEGLARTAIGSLPAEPPGGRGWLAGLPIAIKDLLPVSGVRTTYGSTLKADHVPGRSDLLVERLEANGAVIVGKSNTPEFGAGANTFNDVFGATLNPWDTSRSAGGSSGGSAVAVATGEVWLGHGSDHAGSLRTPASFCGVVGLRPTPGRIARGPDGDLFDDAGVQGPMARTVADTALFLDAMAGDDPRDPISLPPPTLSYVDAVRQAEPPARLAWSRDLGGFTPVDEEVVAVCETALRALASVGTSVEHAEPNVDGLYDAYHTMRNVRFAGLGNQLGPAGIARVSPEIQKNIAAGRAMTGEELAVGRQLRAQLRLAMLDFLNRHGILACPAAVVPPPPVEVRFLESLHGHPFPTYIDWVSISFLATTVACPAIIVPVGRTADGLPVGLQMIGPPRREDVLLAAAAVVESLAGDGFGRPIDPRLAGG